MSFAKAEMRKMAGEDDWLHLTYKAACDALGCTPALVAMNLEAELVWKNIMTRSVFTIEKSLWTVERGKEWSDFRQQAIRAFHKS